MLERLNPITLPCAKIISGYGDGDYVDRAYAKCAVDESFTNEGRSSSRAVGKETRLKGTTRLS